LNIIDVVVASIMVAILVIASFSFFVFIKDSLIDSGNRYEANKFSIATLERLQPLPYADASLAASATPYNEPLPSDCNLIKIDPGASRSYNVTEIDWDRTPPEDSRRYKQILVTTSWIRKGTPKTVSFGVLKRNDQI